MNKKARIHLYLSVPLLILILFLVFLPRHEAPVASNGDVLFVTSWGSDVTGNGKFKKPLGIAAASSGLVYVADSRNSRIQVFNASGSFVTAWGLSGAGTGSSTCLPTWPWIPSATSTWRTRATTASRNSPRAACS